MSALPVFPPLFFLTWGHFSKASSDTDPVKLQLRLTPVPVAFAPLPPEPPFGVRLTANGSECHAAEVPRRRVAKPREPVARSFNRHRLQLVQCELDLARLIADARREISAETKYSPKFLRPTFSEQITI